MSKYFHAIKKRRKQKRLTCYVKEIITTGENSADSFFQHDLSPSQSFHFFSGTQRPYFTTF
jgi:hypothetical protein